MCFTSECTNGRSFTYERTVWIVRRIIYTHFGEQCGIYRTYFTWVVLSETKLEIRIERLNSIA